MPCFAFFLVFNALLIGSHFGVYTMGAHGGFWSLFTNNFRMSGYDNWSWITISCMRVHFETIRHPLFLTLLYPLYWLNHWLINAVGINFCGILYGNNHCLFSILFCYFHLSYPAWGAWITTKRRHTAHAFPILVWAYSGTCDGSRPFYNIAYAAYNDPLYCRNTGKKQGKFINAWQSFLLIFFTAGMAASNAGKTILAGLFTNGRKFFSFKYLTIGIILPLTLLFGIQQMQYSK